MRSHSGFESKVLVAFTAATLVVTVLVLTLGLFARDAASMARWVNHSHDVIDVLARIRTDTLQSEFSTQGFRITGDPARLAERNEAIASRERGLTQLLELTADNPNQQQLWKQLREVLDERLAIARQVEIVRKAEGAAGANAYANSVAARLQETRVRTYGLLMTMETEERRLLHERSEEQLGSYTYLLLSCGVLALILFGLLWSSYVLIRRQLKVAEASRRALMESEESLSTTLRSIGDAVLATDTQGRVTRMNPVAEKLTGWLLFEAKGHPVEDVFHIVHEETRAPAEVPVDRVLATGENQGLANHTAVVRRDGSETPIADSAAPIRDAEGRLSGVVLVFRDVSQERAIQHQIREQNRMLEQRVQERTEQLRASESHLQTLLRNAPILIAFLDSQQRYVYANDQYRSRIAPGQSDITGQTVREVLGDERYQVIRPYVEQVLAGQVQQFDWQPSPGVWKSVSYIPRRDDQGEISGYYLLGLDVSERKINEGKISNLNTELEKHVAQLEHVSRALRTLSAGNRVLLRATQEQELLDSMCEAIVRNGGYSMAAVWYCEDDDFHSLRPVAQSGHPLGLDALREMRVSWAENERGYGAVAMSIRNRETFVVGDLRVDPNYAPWYLQLKDYRSVLACPLCVNDRIVGALAIYDADPDAFDADEILLLGESADDLAFGLINLRVREREQQTRDAMLRLSRYDTLTGLPNEILFTEQLVEALNQCQQSGGTLAVIQANIQRLSEINDVLGFSQGDRVLRDFGSRLAQTMPAPAVLARLRGDEFALLLPGGTEASALAAARKVQAMLTTPFSLGEIVLDVSAKMGVALYPRHGESPHDLFRHMDIAMHQAKRRGVDYAVFDPRQARVPTQQLTLVGELRRAIENDDLRLHLQPKIDFVTGALRGAEALVRWQHAERGMIPPGEFIGLAERVGLIKPLTEWVIETAMRLDRGWLEQGCALPIAVNLSTHNLHDESLLNHLRLLRAGWGLPQGLLELEITESALMEDTDHALRVLHELRDEGIALYIDDFGTGYSSLSYLQKLPVEYIKIDQSFVRDMCTNRDSARIVRSTIDLAHDLGRKVVAEGVETEEHWKQLATFGCDIAQGYFVARPMPAEEFPGWARKFQAAGGVTVTG